MIQNLLKARPDVNLASKRGATPLMAAASGGHAAAVRLLLAEGADPNIAASDDGWTPIMIASKNGHLQIVQDLLHANANASVWSKLGQTSLMGAAYSGNLELVQLLIRSGDNINMLNVAGYSALMNASEKGDVPIVEALLHAGALPTSSHPRHPELTAISVAKAKGHAGIVRILEKSAGRIPIAMLMRYVQVGAADEVKAFIDQGADIKTTSTDGFGPLTLAIVYKRFDIIQILESKGLKFQRSELDRYASFIQANAGADPRERTLADLRIVSAACQAYALDHDSYPKASGGMVRDIVAALQPAYISQFPTKDAWGQAFFYFSFPDGRGFSLVSTGQNGKKNGSLYDTNGSPSAFEKQYKGEALNFNFRGISAGQLFQFLADMSGEKIVLDPGLPEKRIATTLKDVPWDMAMDIFAQILNAGPTLRTNESRFLPIPDADDIYWVVVNGKGESRPANASPNEIYSLQ